MSSISSNAIIGAPIKVEARRYTKPKSLSVLESKWINFAAIHGAGVQSNAGDRHAGVPSTAQGGDPACVAFHVT